MNTHLKAAESSACENTEPRPGSAGNSVRSNLLDETRVTVLTISWEP
jgi:hypothetical protein